MQGKNLRQISALVITTSEETSHRKRRTISMLTIPSRVVHTICPTKGSLLKHGDDLSPLHRSHPDPIAAGPD